MNDKLLLREYATFDYKRSEEDGKPKVSEWGNMLIRGIIQRADTLNQNGRVYPKDVLEKEVKNYMKLVKERRATGCLDHEDSPVVSFQNVSHLITDLWWEDDILMGEVEVLEKQPNGKRLKGLFEDGIRVGISSRGVGSVKKSGDENIVQDDFQLICWDMVSEPSTPGAFMHPITVSESVIKSLTTRSDKINRIANEMLSYKK